ncbi:MAG: hypothetical protein RL757_1426, partial [Bacteroidota bacterium]
CLASLRRLPSLSPLAFFLLMLWTICAAAAGYIINDIEDYEIDVINKPQKMVVGKGISKAISWRLYWGVVIFGFLTSIFCGFLIEDFSPIFIYSICIFLLYVYSKWWKKQFLIGNILIGFFCAFTAFIILLFERKYGWVSFQTWGIFNFSAQNFSILEAEKSVKMVELFLGYSCFAFFSTLFREIVKDMEDMDGDAQTCRTLPIVLGKTAAKWVAFASGILFLLYAYRFVRLQLLAQQVWQPILFIFLIVLPWFWAFFRLFQAKEKADFTRLSAFAKIIMLSGLLLLLFYI